MKTTAKLFLIAIISSVSIISFNASAIAGWNKVCRQIPPTCLTMQKVFDPNTGRLVLTTVIRTIPGRQDMLFLKVSRRFSRSDNLVIQIDRGRKYKIGMRNCRRGFCIARRPFSGSLKKSFLRGRTFEVSGFSNNNYHIVYIKTGMENFRSIYRLKSRKVRKYKQPHDNKDTFDKLFPDM